MGIFFVKPVLETTDGKAVGLIIRVSVHRRVTGVQVSFPRITSALNRRPDVRVGRAIVEATGRIAVAG